MKPLENTALIVGDRYDVGENNGVVFEKVTYKGTAKMYGKPMLVFATKDLQKLTINPSYHAYTLERKENG